MNDDSKPRLAGSLQAKKSKGVPASRQNDQREPEYPADTKQRIVRDTVTAVQAKKPAPVSPVYSRPKPKVASPDADDDYGDDFEDYADEFDEDEGDAAAPPPKLAPAPAPAPSQAKTSAAPERQSKGSRNNPDQQQQQQQEQQLRAQVPPPADPKASRAPAPADLSGIPQHQPQREKKSSSSSSSSSGSGRADNSGSSSSSGGSGGRRVKKFETMSMALDPSAFGKGPKAKRLQRLYDSGVLDMQHEKFTLFSIPSSSTVDHYHRLLRPSQPGQIATLKQVGVPGEDERRSVEVSTDDLQQANKSVQFCYGDDTELLDVMQALTRRKQADKAGIRLTPEESASVTATLRGNADGSRAASSKSTTTGTSMEEEEGISSNATRLPPFLQRASQVCERLLSDEQLRKNGGASKNNRNTTNSSFFSARSQWEELGTSVNGANELVRLRGVTAMQFSGLQPHLLCTAHPYEPGDEEDLLPHKGVYCVWDVSSPGEPVFALCASGQPTSCAFSATQTFLVVGGTSEGTLHLWDLREASAVHRDKDAADLGIERGIRKPCYSSPLSAEGLSMPAASQGSNKDLAAAAKSLDEQHSAPVMQIVGIGDIDPTPAAASQFATLDQRGLICLWLTSQQFAGTGAGDGLSPWGKVALVLTRALHVNPRAAPTADTNLWDFNFGESVGNVGAPSVLAVVPGDMSTLFTAGARGAVSKVVRFGEAPAPHALERAYGSSVEVAFQSRNAAGYGKPAGIDMQLFSEVTCISVQRKVKSVIPSKVSKRNAEEKDNGAEPASTQTDEAQLVLVGRADGSVDLFRSDVSVPLQTWVYEPQTGSSSRSKSTTGRRSPAIASVRWLPNTMSSFVVIDVKGTTYLYDLLIDANSPVCTETLPAGKEGIVTEISRCRSATSAIAYMAVGSPAAGGRVQVRALWEGWLQGTPQDGPRLMEQMPEWALRTMAEKGRLHMVDPLSRPSGTENFENNQHK